MGIAHEIDRLLTARERGQLGSGQHEANHEDGAARLPRYRQRVQGAEQRGIGW